MSRVTSDSTISALREIFAKNGLPEQIVFNNGPQFTASEFENFCKSNGIKHMKSPPYHPATNGQAERFVQTLKMKMKSLKQEKEFKHKLATVLLWYRSTPHATTGVSPSELFLQRRIRTRLDLLHPSMENRVFSRQTMQEKSPMKHTFREFAVGQTFWARNYRGTAKWVGGEILGQLRPVSYEVIVSGGEWKRHADQLRDWTENLGQKHSNGTMTTLPDVQFQGDRVSNSVIPQSI
ncbi:uncharacterized protein K02A2.6-like [Corticium candelabrum]|uniref:uncharacterized protein K02A2.6-like n=1 Tax=Corticium candelabrum TaxID=121492 RepID=UPI002E2554F0|nr:uncharacterized protein K02A2.6-like [Corticium candelabrum]